ncbi:hypothetical protein BOTBODRAFT_182550 [Botryobasidium botryosum FD-172 SS1]|uniref:Uncharacterized protein n=1 Tax=Botryobasidium botryosum (strain FD-172 SS1) TaxID=930990 RepID=A0A067LR60_BOTB1|nr:hypothetical protein BOTBODRAFT_182550 [Botryobasidium botryosum FD-172 SS1]
MASTEASPPIQNPPLAKVDLPLAYRFSRLLHFTKAAVINHNRADPASSLPRSVKIFLSNALGKGFQTISELWHTFGPSVSAFDETRASKEVRLLHTYGYEHGLSVF